MSVSNCSDFLNEGSLITLSKMKTSNEENALTFQVLSPTQQGLKIEISGPPATAILPEASSIKTESDGSASSR